jgi:hypothetical protein
MIRIVVAVLGFAGLGAVAAGAQNLFANPDFDEGVSSWVEGCGSAPVWLDADSAGCAGSGASTQTSGPCQGFQGAGVGQCVPLAGLDGLLFASARVRAASGFSGVLVLFFENSDCTEPSSGQETSPMFPANGEWQAVELANFVVPPGAVTALVGFGAVSGPPVVVDVDAAYFGEARLIFRDGFEGDLEDATTACAWSSTSG